MPRKKTRTQPDAPEASAKRAARTPRKRARLQDAAAEPSERQGDSTSQSPLQNSMLSLQSESAEERTLPAGSNLSEDRNIMPDPNMIALGMVETKGLIGSIEAADAM